jgi:hypothetical protein
MKIGPTVTPAIMSGQGSLSLFVALLRTSARAIARDGLKPQREHDYSPDTCFEADCFYFRPSFVDAFFEDPVYLKTHGHNLELISRKSYRVVGEINPLLAL